MHQTTVELEQQPASKINSPTGFVFTPMQKGGLIVFVLALLYLRLALRRRNKDKVCAHCGHRNPPHRSNCTKCSAPLFTN